MLTIDLPRARRPPRGTRWRRDVPWRTVRGPLRAAIRVRRRMGMGNATFKTWAVIMAVVVLAVLMLWVYQTQH